MSFVAAAIGVVGAVAGGAIAASGAEGAAQTQANAAMNAQNIQQGMFSQVQGNELPFLQSGQASQSQLNYLLGLGSPGTLGNTGSPGTAMSSPAGGYGSLLSPFTAQNFQSLSPAYNFQLQQGQQGVLNQDAGAQGAESGAALKDLMSFNQNYANTSFGNAFNQYQTQQNNIFNRLNAIAGMGAQAGSANATSASQFATGIGNSAQNVGTALAGGTVGAANALSGGLQSAVPWLQAGQGGSSTNVTFNPGPALDTWNSQNEPQVTTPQY